MRLTRAALLVTAITAISHAAESKTIKLGTIAPKGTPWFDGLRDMNEAWREASNGRVRVRIYPGGVIGDEPAMVQKMRIGQLHAAVLTGGGLSMIATEVRTLILPMLFASLEEAAHVRNGVAPTLEAILEQRGFKVLDWGDAGWMRIFSKSPVVRPTDLRRLKIFTWAGGTAMTQAYKDAGLRPVPLPVTEIHTALQSGLINAFVVPPIAALSFQWFGQARHMTDLKWLPLLGAIVVTTRAWNSLPDKLKPLLKAATIETGARTQRAVAKLDAKSIEVMKKHGLVVHPVADQTIPAWETIARAGYDSYLGPIARSKFYVDVVRLRDEYRLRNGSR